MTMKTKQELQAGYWEAIKARQFSTANEILEALRTIKRTKYELRHST